MFSNILETIQNNPLLVTGLGLGSAGMITFWIKNVPHSIFSAFKREFTTELLITSQNAILCDILEWIEVNNKNRSFRKLKLSAKPSTQWGNNSSRMASIGYGSHYIRYHNAFLLLHLSKDSANQTEHDKDILTITKLGRSREIFTDILDEVEVMNDDESKTSTKLYKMENSWNYIKKQEKRSMESIFVEKNKKDTIINTLSKFIDSENWYINHGIPYQLGILLYGAPGTGKTSLIKAIAGYLDYPIYYLSPKNLEKIEDAMSTISDKCVVVIEDIDSNSLTHSRENKNKSEENSILEKYESVSLSEILNSLDGMFSTHGRILIATTNHIESLDAALVRPGRIDLKIEIGYVNNEIFEDFINSFFPENSINLNQITIKPKTTIASLQNLVLQGCNEQQIVEFAEEKD